VMSPDPIILKPTDLVSKARSVVRNKRLRIIPIVTDNKIVGVLSRGDILMISSTKSNLTVEGIMTRNPLTIDAGDELLMAAKTMIKNKVRQLIVLEKENVTGLITMRDILRNFYQSETRSTKAQVEEICSRKVIVCSADEPMSKIWAKMTKTGYGGLPVTEKGKVIGMITRMNLIRRGSRLKIESGNAMKTPAKKFMSSTVITVTLDELIYEAVGKIIKNKINRLPVVDSKNTLLGIVDLEDLLKAHI